jgi:plasmid stabilization system protein ParE
VKPVAHLSDANLELAEAALRYDQQAPGRGERFLGAVADAQWLIQTHPEIGVPYFRKTRRWLVRRFPYAIIYRVEVDRILVVAVAHAKRREGYWVSRLG